MMVQLLKKCGFVFLCVALLISCKKNGCFENAGSIQKSERPATRFNTIDIKDNINLVLTQDTINKIFVEAGEFISSNIKTEIANNVLAISNEASCKWLRN